MLTETQDVDICIVVCLKFCVDYYMCTPSVHVPSNEVGPKSWHLISAIHNEGDCLALCDTDKIMSYDCTHSFVSGLVLCFVVTAQSHVSINLGWVAWINSCHLVY
jgi:hypothetical protein